MAPDPDASFIQQLTPIVRADLLEATRLYKVIFSYSPSSRKGTQLARQYYTLTAIPDAALPSSRPPEAWGISHWLVYTSTISCTAAPSSGIQDLPCRPAHGWTSGPRAYGSSSCVRSLGALTALNPTLTYISPESWMPTSSCAKRYGVRERVRKTRVHARENAS